MRFRGRGLELRIRGFGFRVEGCLLEHGHLGLRVEGLRLKVRGFGFRVPLRIHLLRFRVEGLGFRAEGSGLKVSG